MPGESNTNLQLELGHVLFIDIVGYSKLLIDEQREALGTLNQVVRETDCLRGAAADRAPLCLPTGDGVALVFSRALDAPVRCAVQIARELGKRAPAIRVRMGIHSGPVSSLSDLNERPNFAGAGINVAQRIMDCGDAGHILVSERVASDLVQAREWQGRLRDLGIIEVKHGAKVHVFNLVGDDFGNAAAPAKLKTGRSAASRMRASMRDSPRSRSRRTGSNRWASTPACAGSTTRRRRRRTRRSPRSARSTRSC
jgi:class 3 adenylate cyclase